MQKKVTIQRDQIDESQTLPVSLMQPGLLNTPSKEEILDLFAFPISGRH